MEREEYGYGVEIVIWLVLMAILAGSVLSLRHMRLTREPSPTAASVHADGANQPAPDVTAWAQDELAYINRDWHLPTYTFAVVSPLSWNGITVIADKPVRYAVVIVRWAYPVEGQVRFTTAHEAGHILQSEAGLPQSEQTADQFALCFGSAKAQEYAKSDRHTTADCGELRQTLTAHH